MSTVEQARKQQLEQLVEAIRAGGGLLPAEAHDGLNNSNRALIHAMIEAHGQCWLGRVNLDPNKYHHTAIMWQRMHQDVEPEIVYNFGADYVIPCYDEELERLVKRWNNTPLKEMTAAMIDEIFDRIKALGGYNLNWS